MSEETKKYFGFPGELFVRVLQFITLPLYFCKLITGIVDLKKITTKRKRIAFQIVLFFSVSLIVSVLIGFLLVLTIKPGNRNGNLKLNYSNPFPNQVLTTSDTILDTFRYAFCCFYILSDWLKSFFIFFFSNIVPSILRNYL